MWNDEIVLESQKKDDDDFSRIEARRSSNNSESLDKTEPKFSWIRVRSARKLLWNHFTTAYTDKTVLIWSIWWALAMAGFLMIQSYVQLLWQVIRSDDNMTFNGGVEAALTCFGAISCLVRNFIIF